MFRQVGANLHRVEQNPSDKAMEEDRQQLTKDPVYFIMVAVFAALTTALPALLGQTRFLPVVQAIAVTIFLAIPIRAGHWRRGVLVFAVWLTVGLIVASTLAWFAPVYMGTTLASHPDLQAQIVAWTFDAGGWPGVVTSQPVRRMIELAAYALSSLATAGLAGNWFVMRSMNQIGLSIGVVGSTIGGPSGLLLAIPVWNLLQISGMSSLVILLSEPILSGRWSPRFYWESRRTLILMSSLLVLAGLALETIAPPLWQSWISQVVN